MVNLPRGGSTIVWFDYERVLEWCYACQHLTHEKDKCPLLIQQRQETALARKQSNVEVKQSTTVVITKSDPLFGVVSEEQDGINPLTGRLRIAPGVLQNMRDYLTTANGPKKR